MDLESLKNTIEALSKTHQLEILKLLDKHESVKINVNKSGSFINMSMLDPAIIEELVAYVDFINTQEKSISKLELEKKEMESLLVEKEVKEYWPGMYSYETK
jgi:hypothetical protein